MTTQTQFSTEALRSALQSRLGLSLDLEDVRALADEAATNSGTSPALAMADDVGPFFYNVVFLSMDHTPMASPLFITVKTSTRISYGSDLLTLREEIKKMLNYEDLVITSYTELAGPVRPREVVPTVEIAQTEPHRRRS